MGNNSSNFAPPPMKIHALHGKFLKVSSDRLIATRFEGYADAMFFGSRIAARNERIELTIRQLTKDWNGSIRFGFTSHDPIAICNHPEGIPRFMCPDLVKRGGSFIETLNHIRMIVGDRIVFWVTPDGEIRLSVNDVLQRNQVTKLVTQPVWPVVDVYGNAVEVKFRSLSDDPDQLEDVKDPRYYSSLNLTEMRFVVNPQSIDVINKVTLQRKNISKAFAWNETVFGVNHVWCLFITEIDNTNARNLSLAVMNKLPSETLGNLPDTLERFNDRPKIFNNIYTRNVVGDEVAICVINNGQVMVALNGDEFQLIGQVPTSDQYWLVVDLNCVVKCIRSLGCFPLIKDCLPQLPNVKGGNLPRERSFQQGDSQPVSETGQRPIAENNTYSPSIPVETTDESKCIKCKSEKPNAVFIPCGHIYYCKSCADKYMGQGSKKCPKCAAACDRAIKVFF